MSERPSSPFDARIVLLLLAIGAALFIGLLYILGTGEPNREKNDGGAHAYSKGMTGYTAYAELLESQGHEVNIVQGEADLNDEILLILTPPMGEDADTIARIVDERRYIGPTIIILPKWSAGPIPEEAGLDAIKPGWVNVWGSNSPAWLTEIEGLDEPELTIDGKSGSWVGLGHSGKLPVTEEANDKSVNTVQWIKDDTLASIVRDGKGRMLAGFINDDYFEVLADMSGNATVNGPTSGDTPEDYTGDDKWPVVIVAEPDLLNNFGMAEFATAQQSLSLVEATLDGYDFPIAFDVTLNGLGGTQNLLTLAFTPPFLAATLCLIIAALLVAWRAFLRFGPALAEGRQIAFGKEQLVTNSAGLINRAKRTHLLADPYVALMRRRIVKGLGLRQRSDAVSLDEAIDRAMAARLPSEPPFTHSAQALRAASGPQEILRKASALKTLERTLTEP